MMLPERAALGTVATSPAALARNRAAGELRLMRAPRRAGKATIHPALNPLPTSSSVPCTETWCGLALHLACGVQVALVMRTEVTCALGVADAAEAEPARTASSSAVMTAARAAAAAAAGVSCGLCARVLPIGSLRASCFLHPM